MTPFEQPPLFNRRVSTPLPGLPNGQDVAFRCFADDGRLYYCKADKDGRAVRAIEWFATSLAKHLRISVAEAAIIEDDDGQTYFGSRSPTSLADEVEVQRYLGTPATGELGQPIPWLGQYLAQLFAFDMFIDNPDRNLRNFIIDRDGGGPRLQAIDFASARLMNFSVERFPIESENTVWVGRIVRGTHGAHLSAALEMLDWIAAVPFDAVETIIGQMPDDWLNLDQREGLRGIWSDGRRNDRIARLRALLGHELQI